MAPLTSNQRSRICTEARKWLGTPFRMFGRTRRGIGCSSFVSQVYKSIGINLIPKTDWLFLNLDIIPPKLLQPGDIVFYCRSPRPKKRLATHVAIYIGNGKVINSSQREGGVVEQDLESISGLLVTKDPNVLKDWLNEMMEEGD